VTAISLLGFEMYVYGEGAEAGEQLCNIAGDEWTDQGAERARLSARGVHIESSRLTPTAPA
jgi:hypothetical protein